MSKTSSIPVKPAHCGSLMNESVEFEAIQFIEVVYEFRGRSTHDKSLGSSR